MPNENAEHFIAMANEDLNAMEEFRYFEFRSANATRFVGACDPTVRF